MRIAAWMWAGGAALMLAACGSQTSGEFTTEDGGNAAYTIDKDSGETSMTVEGPQGTATLRSGAEVPVSLPDGFSLYPGARIITNTLVKQPDGQGTMVMFETADGGDKVIAHFRQQAMGAGFDVQLEMDTNGTKMIGGERKDGSTFSVTAGPGGEAGTTGQLIIASKSGG